MTDEAPTGLLLDAERAVRLIEALQPYLDDGYIVYLMGPSWAFLERPVSAWSAWLFGSLYLVGRKARSDQYLQLSVHGDGRVTAESRRQRPG